MKRRTLLKGLMVGLGSLFGVPRAKATLSASTAPVFPAGFIPVAGHTAESAGMIFNWPAGWSSFEGWALPMGGENVHRLYLDGRQLTNSQTDGAVVRAIAGKNGLIQYYLKTVNGNYILNEDCRLVAELQGSEFQTATKRGHVVYGVMEERFLPYGHVVYGRKLFIPRVVEVKPEKFWKDLKEGDVV